MKKKRKDPSLTTGRMLPDGTYAMAVQPTDYTDRWCASFYADKAEKARKRQAKEEAKRRARHAKKRRSRGLVPISPFGGLQGLGGSCATHDSCNSGICVSGACSPCVGTSCTGTKYCWNGKCLAHMNDRLKDHLACGTCPSEYKCATVKDMLDEGRACVYRKGNPWKGKRCPWGGAYCNTYCKNGIFVRNPFPNTQSLADGASQSVINGVVVGFCETINARTAQQRCIGDFEVSATR